jgi:hypothetical protein
MLPGRERGLLDVPKTQLPANHGLAGRSSKLPDQ